ncbi:DUF1775 domain-containing protein [Rhizobium sp. S-51]|uniref:DUF1775 domain-containing protein n=1 Tax=Rhizobium terricola TaxID=2728849 RepID=A0A7Y0FVK5_9HYPH|nr:DUF1775 domain-containing protein [Rhizobium terricola]NML73724.1 DUF1775 domain-containing protein [Rhizobium terricola]
MKITTSLLTAAVASLAAGSAHAHATFANAPAKPESYVAAVLQVPHGCDGKATNEVQIKLPEGFISAKPMVKPGWQIEVIKGDYKKTYDNHGKKITSGPVEIRFKGGELPDDFYDTFTVYGKISGVDGQSGLAFPTVQLCGADGKVAWDEIAGEGVDPHSLKSPAPVLKIAAAEGEMMMGHGAMHGDGHQMQGHGAMDGSGMAGANPGTMEPVKVGDLDLTAGFTRAMLPGQPVGGGFITITNNGHHEDTLVSAESSVAGHMELHEMAMVGDVMKMRPLKDGIQIPAGQTVELKPGGLHMMFMEVKEPFVEGNKVTVKLTFAKAGTVEVVLPVGPAKGK